MSLLSQKLASYADKSAMPMRKGDLKNFPMLSAVARATMNSRNKKTLKMSELVAMRRRPPRG